MTDEELYTLFEDNDDPSNGMASYRALFDAGYRAAMEAAKKNYDDLRAGDWSYKSSWEVHGEWLEQQAKKEQT